MASQYTFEHRLDDAALRQLLTGSQGGVMKDMLKRGLKVETRAKQNLGGGESGPKRVDTGRLRASISTQVIDNGGHPYVTVGTNVFYAIYVHEGTGIYGPRRRAIRPKRGKLFRFKPKARLGPYKITKGGIVYAHEIQGMRPNHFLRDALIAAR